MYLLLVISQTAEAPCAAGAPRAPQRPAPLGKAGPLGMRTVVQAHRSGSKLVEVKWVHANRSGSGSKPPESDLR